MAYISNISYNILFLGYILKKKIRWLCGLPRCWLSSDTRRHWLSRCQSSGNRRRNRTKFCAQSRAAFALQVRHRDGR